MCAFGAEVHRLDEKRAVRERPSQCGKGSWQGMTHGVYNSCADMPSRIPSLRFVAIALMGGFLWWISYDLED